MAVDDQTAVVVPAFNHRRALRRVLADVGALGLLTIVVDDGSTDGTAEMLAAWAADGNGRAWVRLDKNLGKAAALLAGFAEARRLGCTHAVSLDADGQLDAADIPAVLAAARAEPGALVIGRREVRIAGCPRRSLVGRWLAGVAVRAQTGRWIEDTQCGLRCYPLGLVSELGCRSGRFSFETEVIVRALWRRASVVEVPVGCSYRPPEGRTSHFRPMVDSWRQLVMHGRLLAERDILARPGVAVSERAGSR